MRVDALQERLPRTKQDGCDDQVQLVDQPHPKILPNRRGAATEAYVAAACRSLRLLQSRVNTAGDEPELRAALHRDGCARMMRQHEHRRVVRGLVAPPAFPAFVRPRTANRTEHIASEDPGADAGKALLRHFVVDARLPLAGAVHLLP